MWGSAGGLQVSSAESWGRALTTQTTGEAPKHPVLAVCQFSPHHRQTGKAQKFRVLFSNPLQHRSDLVTLESREREGRGRGRMKTKKMAITSAHGVQAAGAHPVYPLTVCAEIQGRPVQRSRADRALLGALHLLSLLPKVARGTVPSMTCKISIVFSSPQPQSPPRASFLR